MFSFAVDIPVHCFRDIYDVVEVCRKHLEFVFLVDLTSNNEPHHAKGQKALGLSQNRVSVDTLQDNRGHRRTEPVLRQPRTARSVSD